MFYVLGAIEKYLPSVTAEVLRCVEFSCGFPFDMYERREAIDFVGLQRNNVSATLVVARCGALGTRATRKLELC